VGEDPRRQSDGTHEGLAMPRRHVDDKPLCLASGDAGEFLGEKLEVFVIAKAAALVERREGLHREGEKFGLYQLFDLDIHEHYSFEELAVASVLLLRLVE